jgi:hypothetical protein
MKTIFTKEEIVDFFQKKKDVIQGEEILSRVTPDFHDFPDGISPLDMMAFIYKKGVEHGKIEGNIELMNELILFFEL